MSRISLWGCPFFNLYTRLDEVLPGYETYPGLSCYRMKHLASWSVGYETSLRVQTLKWGTTYFYMISRGVWNICTFLKWRCETFMIAKKIIWLGMQANILVQKSCNVRQGSSMFVHVRPCSSHPPLPPQIRFVHVRPCWPHLSAYPLRYRSSMFVHVRPCSSMFDHVFLCSS